MPSLGKHDPKAHIKVTKEEVNDARRIAETVICVDGLQLQFDNVSRQRMRDVANAVGPNDEVSWRLYDNRLVTLTGAELLRLYEKAEAEMGVHTLKIFRRADKLKQMIDAGETVTQADLRLSAWSY